MANPNETPRRRFKGRSRSPRTAPKPSTATNLPAGEVTIVKVKTARQTWGRGSDQQRFPARYEVRRGGTPVGYIAGTATGYMEKSDWELYEFNGVQRGTGAKGGIKPVRYFPAGAGSPFTKAKAWAAEYFEPKGEYEELQTARSDKDRLSILKKYKERKGLR
jgi:hypothetical protein